MPRLSESGEVIYSMHHLHSVFVSKRTAIQGKDELPVGE